MTAEDIRSIVDRFTQELRKEWDVHMVILYGTGLLHRQKEDDIDVAVFVSKLEGDYIETQTSMGTLAKKIDSRIEPDLIDMRGEDPTEFVDELLIKGEIIYKKPSD